MSEPQPESSGPRRSQRDKKTAKPFVSASSTRKRKRGDTDADNDAPSVSDQEDVEEPGSEDDNEADEDEEAQKTPKARKTKAKSSPKTKSTPATKKPRAEKSTLPKVLKPKARRGRKPKEGEGAYDADQVAKDTKISPDNPLFNAIMNPASALQSSAEDFLDSLQQSPGAALAELVNLVLRACGCNDSVDADQAVDFDGIVSTLDDFTEVLKQENSPVYPLTSKLPVFKRFRKSLSEWIERLIISASDLGLLYSSQLMETLQQWVVSMSSSQIRSFRHTASVIALEAETALCDVAAAVDKEGDIIARQREGEKKRKGKGGNPQLEAKGKEVKQRQNKLKQFIKEFVDGVFVHRFRDLDPNIRAECVRAIGLWLKKYPDHFLDANYLRYIGWVLSDSNNHVRLEAVKALSGVYQKPEYLHSVTNFTERFKPRLLEMATSDIELGIRVAVIQVLSDIETHFPLEDQEKEKLCLLLFDEEPKVRRAVSSFVRAVWEEEMEEQVSAQHKPTEKAKERIGIKVVAQLLVKWGKALDTLSGDAADSELGDEDTEGDIVNGQRQSKRRKELIALVTPDDRGRITLGVEALWDQVGPVSDWEGLLELLLLDHSASEDESQVGPTPRGRAKANGKKHTDDFQVDEAWRLEEAEESTLLEVLVSAIRIAKEESVGGKKGEEENVSNDVTRALIKGLPRLFIKHQSDQNRIAEVLVLPTLMNLDLYLEMRMITAYSSLWDDVIKQFTSHSSAKVLAHAMATIRYFMAATSLSNANSTKILELEDELSTQLRDTIAGREEIEIASFSEDEVLALSAWCMRFSVLAGARNMTTWIEEDEGGKQSSAWDIVSALVERGRLGYKEEETLIERALQVLMLHVLWKTKGLPVDDDDLNAEEIRYKEVMLEQRESLLEKLVEYAVGTQSNTVEGVKRAAFKHLLDLHVLFSSSNAHGPDGKPLPIASLSVTLDDETQYRCAGYIQAEIERYAEFLDDDEEAETSQKSDAGSDANDEDAAEDGAKASKKARAKKPRKEADLSPRESLEREYLFIDIVSTFLRAIRAGAIHIQHGAVVLAHYGRLDVAFDTCSKVVVDVLREEALMKENPELIVAVVIQAVEEAHSLVLDGIVRDETNGVHLAKVLAGCFIVRGSQLAVIRRLESQHVVQVQTTLLSWIIKRIAGYEKNKNKKSLKSAIAFFKVLVPLLNALPSREALKIKAHMDQALEEAKIEIAASAKVWEPQRAYEKRLTALMSKDNPQAPKTKRTKKRGATGASSEEETDGERTNDEDARPRSKPRRVTRSNPGAGDDEGTADEAAPGPTTPKPKPKPKPRARPVRRKKTPSDVLDEEEGSLPGSPMDGVTPSEEQDEPEDPEPEEPEPEPEPIPKTPKSARKRPRDDEEADANEADEAADEPEEPEIKVRRKRLRP